MLKFGDPTPSPLLAETPASLSLLRASGREERRGEREKEGGRKVHETRNATK